MIDDIHHDKIVILDFGSQYTQLIARRIREIGIYCEIHRNDMSDQQLYDLQPAGIILSGGPATVTKTTTPRVPEAVFKFGCPILGICYGMQAMVKQLGGQVQIARHHEYGFTQIRIEHDGALFQDIADHIDDHNRPILDVWMSHGDHVTEVAKQFNIVASSENAPIAAIADEKKQWYGLQFHPEVTHTTQGKRLLKRFAIDICRCKPLWQVSNIITSLIDHIQQTVGDEQVILALSGGVDSSVLAALLNKAIAKQLHCVFVDSGLLRQHEASQVITTFKKHFGIDITCVNASEQFLQALAGIDDPEQKRKIIGHTFIEIFEQQADRIKNISWLAQGTIYPDVIESAQATNQAATIKSHHNVAGLPDTMQLKLLEPLRELFKDEVRNLGLELGLAHEVVYRHPFPGPGLAVRILGEIRRPFIDILRQADAIFIEELYKKDLYQQVSQAFAVFLPVKSVGVVGDNRQYEYVIALRAVETTDFMTAQWARLPHDFLAHVSNRIINEVPRVSRVIYDISSKPPATIEWE